MKDAAVRLHDFGGQPRQKAFVAPRPEADPGRRAEHLHRRAADCQPAPARPDRLAVVPALPVNTEGKACDGIIAPSDWHRLSLF